MLLVHRYQYNLFFYDLLDRFYPHYRRQWAYVQMIYELNRSLARLVGLVFLIIALKWLLHFPPHIKMPWHEKDINELMYRRPLEEPLVWPRRELTPFDQKYADLYELDYRLSHPLENDCKLPVLMPNEPDLMNDVKHYLEANCTPATGPILVKQMVDGSLLVGNQLNANVNDEYECFAQEMQGTLRPTKNETQFVGPLIKLPKNRRFFLQKDQFHVFCKDANDTTIFEDAFTYVPYKKRLNPPLLENTNNFSIAILVLDSTSRNQFFRHAPQTSKFMKEQGFQILHGFNKVADNSAVNLLPLLSGKTFSTGFHGNRHLVDESMVLSQGMADVDFEHYAKNIIDVMKERGCATQWSDDIMVSNFGLFNYNIFKGFWTPPADYYYRQVEEQVSNRLTTLFRPYYEYMYRDNEKFRTVNQREVCVNGELMSRRMLQMWERFSTRYARHCHFSFNFLTHITHDTGNTLELIDQTIYDSLIRMKYRGVFDNTVLIIMGDHGQRVSDIQKTYSGRIEERMPMFSMFFPDKFKRLYPEKIKRFMINKNRLVSHFDLHETLREILYLNATEGDRSLVGQSLLCTGMKRSRRCSEARIVHEHCTCLESVDKELVPEEDKQRMVALLRSYVADVVANSSCFNSATLYEPYHFLPYTVNPKVRVGIRCPKPWHEMVQNGTAYNKTSNEIFDVDLKSALRTRVMIAETQTNGESTSELKTFDFTLRARLHYNRLTKYVRLVTKPYITSQKLECAVQILEDVCMCFDANNSSS